MAANGWSALSASAAAATHTPPAGSLFSVTKTKTTNTNAGSDYTTSSRGIKQESRNTPVSNRGNPVNTSMTSCADEQWGTPPAEQRTPHVNDMSRNLAISAELRSMHETLLATIDMQNKSMLSWKDSKEERVLDELRAIRDEQRDLRDDARDLRRMLKEIGVQCDRMEGSMRSTTERGHSLTNNLKSFQEEHKGDIKKITEKMAEVKLAAENPTGLANLQREMQQVLAQVSTVCALLPTMLAAQHQAVAQVHQSQQFWSGATHTPQQQLQHSGRQQHGSAPPQWGHQNDSSAAVLDLQSRQQQVPQAPQPKGVPYEQFCEQYDADHDYEPVSMADISGTMAATGGRLGTQDNEAMAQLMRQFDAEGRQPITLDDVRNIVNVSAAHQVPCAVGGGDTRVSAARPLWPVDGDAKNDSLPSNLPPAPATLTRPMTSMAGGVSLVMTPSAKHELDKQKTTFFTDKTDKGTPTGAPKVPINGDTAAKPSAGATTAKPTVEQPKKEEKPKAAVTDSGEKPSIFAGFKGFGLAKDQTDAKVAETKAATTAPAFAFGSALFGAPDTVTSQSAMGVGSSVSTSMPSKPLFSFGGSTAPVATSTPTTVATVSQHGKSPTVVQSPTVKTGAGDRTRKESEQSEDHFEPSVDFKPVVPLPDLVELVTGEEEEQVLFCERAKLYRFTGNEFKERGLGDLKILKHKTSGKTRILMRREQVHKLCANHRLSSGMSLAPLTKSDRAFVWHCNDFAEEELRDETVAARFKTPEIAVEFKKVFEDCVSKASPLTPEKPKATSEERNEKEKSQPKEVAPSAAKDFSAFLNAQKSTGKWTCDACYAGNGADDNVCLCCSTPRPGFEPSKGSATTAIDAVKEPPKSSFSFGLDLSKPTATSTPESNKQPVPSKSEFSFGIKPVGQPAAESKAEVKTKDVPQNAAVFAPTATPPKATGSASVTSSTAGTASSFSFKVASTQGTGAAAAGYQPSPPASTKAAFGGTAVFGSVKAPEQPKQQTAGAAPPSGGSAFGGGSVFGSASVFGGGAAVTTAAPTAAGFGSLAAKAPAGTEENKPKSTFSSNMGANLFSSFGTKPGDKDMSRARVESSPGADENYEPDVHFQPVVPLPDKVDVVTGEEDEEVVFCERAKLFRFVKTQKESEFKERGTGDMKILRNPATGAYRLLMRREHVHKICANHRLSAELKLTPKTEKSYVWRCMDFSESELAEETFAVRFKTAEIATKFKDVFEAACRGDVLPAVRRHGDSADQSVAGCDLNASAGATSGAASSKPSGGGGGGAGGTQSNSVIQGRSLFGASAFNTASPGAAANTSATVNLSGPINFSFRAPPTKADLLGRAVNMGGDDNLSKRELIAKYQLPEDFYDERPPCPGCIGCLLTDEQSDTLFDFIHEVNWRTRPLSEYTVEE